MAPTSAVATRATVRAAEPVMFGGSAKSISMGHVKLEAEDLLTATTLDLGAQLTSGGEKVQGVFSKVIS